MQRQAFEPWFIIASETGSHKQYHETHSSTGNSEYAFPNKPTTTTTAALPSISSDDEETKRKSATTTNTTTTPAIAARTAGRYILGLFLVFLLCLVWTVASILTQYLYTEQDFASPFLMTYIGVTTLAMLLPIKFLTDGVGCTVDPCRRLESDSFDHDVASAGDYRDVMEIVTVRTNDLIQNKHKYWSHKRHILAALHIGPVMFLADWAFNASLFSTSVASSTVLVTTSNVFVFCFAVMVGDEVFRMVKLLGVILALVGTTLTAVHDTVHYEEEYIDSNPVCAGRTECGHVLWGDTLSVLAAVCYAAYAVQVRVLCPQDEELYSMQLLLGYIGLVCVIPLFPFAVYSCFQIQVTWAACGMSLVKGIFDFVLTDYLMFRAVILTNATIATVGLGLTVPLAFAADFVMNKANVASPFSLMGAAAVMIGFSIVNLAEGGHQAAIEETSNTNNNEQSRKDDDSERADYNGSEWLPPGRENLGVLI